MIMPCMNFVSASAGSRAALLTLAAETILLFSPGAPGWTMGTAGTALEGAGACWLHADALRKSKAEEKNQNLGAMQHYKSWCFAGSTPKDSFHGVGRSITPKSLDSAKN